MSQDRRCYINTLYNQFYMGGASWEKFKILVDLVLMSSSKHSLSHRVIRQLQGLTHVRRLLVDIGIFTEVSLKWWSKFNLEVLTTVFYPTSAMEKRSKRTYYKDDGLLEEPKFRKPTMNSKFGRRAE